jgi:Ca2+-dependent lipid-binding protein
VWTLNPEPDSQFDIEDNKVTLTPKIWTLNPKPYSQFEIKDSKVSGDIVLTVSDWDMASANDFIGTARINISQIDAELGNPIGARPQTKALHPES